MTHQSQPAACHHHTLIEPQRLAATIEYIDCLADEGLSEISSLARLALISLETPDGYRNFNDIANALISIWSKADLTRDHIKCEAEQLGCEHSDDAKQRRLNAQRTHQQTLGA